MACQEHRATIKPDNSLFLRNFQRQPRLGLVEAGSSGLLSADRAVEDARAGLRALATKSSSARRLSAAQLGAMLWRSIRRGSRIFSQDFRRWHLGAVNHKIRIANTRSIISLAGVE